MKTTTILTLERDLSKDPADSAIPSEFRSKVERGAGKGSEPKETPTEPETAPVPVDGSESALAQLERVRCLLAEVQTVPQAQKVVAAAKALETYAKQTKASAAILQLAFRFRSLAKRRLGETIVKMQAAGELEGRGGNRRSKSSPSILKLKDLDLSSNESSQAQAFASIPEAEFERMLDETGSGELSDKALLRRIRAARAEGSPKDQSSLSKSKPVKTKTPPSTKTLDDAPPPTPVSVGKVSVETAVGNAAESFEEMMEEWRRRSWEPLMGRAGLSARVSVGLEGLDEELDRFVNDFVERLRSLGS
jgi:hypothetical protein